MCKRFTLITLLFLSFLSIANQSAVDESASDSNQPMLDLMPESIEKVANEDVVLVLKWREKGKEQQFRVSPKEAHFVRDYVTPFVQHMAECRSSGKQCARYCSLIPAVSTTWFSWEISKSLRSLASCYGFQKIKTASYVAPFLVGGLTYILFQQLLKRGFILWSLSQKKSTLKTEPIERLVQAIFEIKQIIGVRFVRLWNALYYSTTQNGCSDDMKKLLFGFEKPDECSNDFVSVIKSMFTISPLELLLNPKATLNAFVLSLCNG